MQPDEFTVFGEHKNEHLTHVPHILFIRQVIERGTITVHVPNSGIEHDYIRIELCVNIADETQNYRVVGTSYEIEADMEFFFAVLSHFSVGRVIF